MCCASKAFISWIYIYISFVRCLDTHILYIWYMCIRACICMPGYSSSGQVQLSPKFFCALLSVLLLYLFKEWRPLSRRAERMKGRFFLSQRIFNWMRCMFLLIFLIEVKVFTIQHLYQLWYVKFYWNPILIEKFRLSVP